MIKRNQLIYAIKDGVATSIENVESGLKCGCICPSCGEPLVARKGAKRMHHFAHYFGHNCEYGYETSLHLAAKEILSKANRIMLPAVYVQFPNSPKAPELYCESKEIEIERVELEKRFQDVIPDVVIYAGGKQLFLEVYVTHAIDDVKLKKLKESDISTISAAAMIRTADGWTFWSRKPAGVSATWVRMAGRFHLRPPPSLLILIC